MKSANWCPCEHGLSSFCGVHSWQPVPGVEKVVQLRRSRARWRAHAERLEKQVEKLRFVEFKYMITNAPGYASGRVFTFMGEKVEDIWSERERLKAEIRMLRDRARCNRLGFTTSGRETRCGFKLGHPGGVRMKRFCASCAYPAPMHRPECPAVPASDVTARGALRALLFAVAQLPVSLCQELVKSQDFVNAYRAGKEALR